MSKKNGGTIISDIRLGDLLKNTRIDMGVSVDQIALRLNLDKHVVISLENNDYENLPGPTYVRGYLRSYATLLDLNIDDVIAESLSLNRDKFKPMQPMPEPIEELSSNRPAGHAIKSKKKKKNKFFITTTIVLLGLFVLYQANQKIDAAKVLEFFKLSDFVSNSDTNSNASRSVENVVIENNTQEIVVEEESVTEVTSETSLLEVQASDNDTPETKQIITPNLDSELKIILETINLDSPNNE